MGKSKEILPETLSLLHLPGEPDRALTCWRAALFLGLGASAVTLGALGAGPSLRLFQSPLTLPRTFPCLELNQGAKN